MMFAGNRKEMFEIISKSGNKEIAPDLFDRLIMMLGSRQYDLFRANDGPEGLRVQDEFVSRERERDLIDHVGKLSLEKFQFGAFQGKRRVAFFGSRYDFTAHTLEAAAPMPEWLRDLANTAEEREGLPSGAIHHALVTEYRSGAGIGWHKDKPQFRDVYGLSLRSACPIRFRRREGSKWRRYTMQAAPRSLYILSGEARMLWEHSISPVPELRYSITFRTMR